MSTAGILEFFAKRHWIKARQCDSTLMTFAAEADAIEWYASSERPLFQVRTCFTANSWQMFSTDPTTELIIVVRGLWIWWQCFRERVLIITIKRFILIHATF